jgi:hypothetical protein
MADKSLLYAARLLAELLIGRARLCRAVRKHLEKEDAWI